jgi:glycosyltransferase involved in cell wall biosynthesis
MDTLISVIIPVYNRRIELEKCLKSLLGQTYNNFEAIVIDDASTLEIRDIVENMHDPRFIYIRNEKNGGPYNARTVGWKICKGEYFVNLDSDWEAFPWMLQRAIQLLDETPEADAVTGMFLRNEDSLVFARVRKGIKLVTPDDDVVISDGIDCIAVIRRSIIDEWLKKSHDYFALECHSWLAFSLKHSQLYIDEPWALYHTDSLNRVSPLLGKNQRQINDCLLFLKDYDNILQSVPRKDIDRMLITITKIFLKDLHWNGVKKCLFYMRIRNMAIQRILTDIIISGVVSRLGLSLKKRRELTKVTWID